MFRKEEVDFNSFIISFLSFMFYHGGPYKGRKVDMDFLNKRY